MELNEITKCGFYRAGEDDEAGPEFGHLHEWWSRFSEWVSGGDYSRTSTFTRSRVPHSVYCTGQVEDGRGNSGVALWNETPSTQGGLLYLPASGNVNGVQVGVASVGGGSRAGWPSYFWFLPDISIIAALIPEGFRGSAIPYARLYFQEYLKKHSEYARREVSSENPDEYRILGYNRIGVEAPLTGLEPKFETRPLRRKGSLEEVADRWREIRKYVINSSVSYQGPSPQPLRSLIESLMGGAPSDSRNEHKRSFRLELDWNPPSREDVVEVIRGWEEAGYDDNNWAGVRLKNEGRIYRFDEMVCRESIEVNSKLDANPPWGVDDLANVWEGTRATAEQLLRRAGIDF